MCRAAPRGTQGRRRARGRGRGCPARRPSAKNSVAEALRSKPRPGSPPVQLASACTRAGASPMTRRMRPGPGAGTIHVLTSSQRMAAGVEQSATAELGIHADVALRSGERDAEARVHCAHAADGAGLKQRDHVGRVRLEPVRVALQQHDAALARRAEQGLRLGQREGERLVALQVLAGFGGVRRPGWVQALGPRDIDGVDLGVGERRFVAAVVACDAVRGGEGGGRLGAPAGGGNDAHAPARCRPARGMVAAGGLYAVSCGTRQFHPAAAVAANG